MYSPVKDEVLFNSHTLSLYELFEEFIPRGIAWNIGDIIVEVKKRHCCILRVSKYHQYLENRNEVNLCSFVPPRGKEKGQQRNNCVDTESERGHGKALMGLGRGRTEEWY